MKLGFFVFTFLFSLTVFAEKFFLPIDEISKFGLEVTSNDSSTTFRLVDRNKKNWTGNKTATSAIASGLKFVQSNTTLQPSINSKGEMTIQEAGAIDVFVHRRFLGRVVLSKGKPQWTAGGSLTSFDIRMYGKKGAAYGASIPLALTPAEVQKYRSPVDLHTHFGGALRSEEILRIALEHKVAYPTALLDEAKVAYPAEYKGQKTVPFTKENISAKDLPRLVELMNLPSTEVVTLERMEVSYKFRGPLVKYRPAFHDYMRSLADDYKRNGVNYALLSLSDVSWTEWLSEAHKILPQIEKETGVKIRFLVALWRHSPEQFNMDVLARTRALMTSPYIVGYDFMGHETNSTYAIENVIRAAKKTMEDAGVKEGVNRVHGGENSFYLSNVSDALEFGSNQIGHGLYGINAKTLKLLVEKGGSVEINTGSNVALNNAATAEEIPLRTYIDHSVPTTLGTDGHGLYGESPASQLYGALYAGATKEDLAGIRAYSESYIERKETEFQTRLSLNPTLTLPEKLPDGVFKGSDWGLEDARKLKMKADILQRLKGMGVEPHESLEAFNKTVKGLKPVMISGASMFSYQNIALQDRETILKSIRKMLTTMNPKKVYFITGGSDYGVEKIFHQEVVRYNEIAVKAGRPSFRMMGGLVTENRGTLYELGRVTDALTVAPWWYERSAALLRFVAENKGQVVYWGGGNIIVDEIQTARNNDIKFLVAKGPAGASDKAAALYPENSFTTTDQLIEKLKSNQPSLFLSDSKAVSWVIDQKFHWMDRDQAIAQIRSEKKEVVSFLGFSSQDYADHQKFHDILAQELRQLDPNKVIISAGGSQVGIGYVYEVAQKMGFKTIGIVSEKAGDPGNQAPHVNEIFVIKDGLYGGYDIKTGERSGTTEAAIAVSSKLIALGGGKISGQEIQMFQQAGIPVKFYELQTNPVKSVANFIKSLRGKVQKRLQGRDREFSDGSVDLALKTLGEARYEGLEISKEVLEAGKKRIINETAAMYDIGNVEDFAERVMLAALEEYKTLDAEALEAYFSKFGVARKQVKNKTNRTSNVSPTNALMCQQVF